MPSDGHLQAAYAHRDEPVWELPVPEGDAVLYGVGPAQLQGLQGFQRRDGDLVPGLYVARALGYLISTDPPTAPAIERKLTYISSNGFFVAHPPVSGQDVPAIMQRIARSAYFRNNLPQANPSREMRWSLLPAEDGRDDMYLTLSVPLYLDEQFRGVAVVEISQGSLDNYLTASTHTGVRSFLMDAEGNLLGASAGSVEPGEQFSWSRRHGGTRLPGSCSAAAPARSDPLMAAGCCSSGSATPSCCWSTISRPPICWKYSCPR